MRDTPGHYFSMRLTAVGPPGACQEVAFDPCRSQRSLVMDVFGADSFSVEAGHGASDPGRRVYTAG